MEFHGSANNEGTRGKNLFSLAISNTYDLPISQLPPRTVKGDCFSVKISQHEYELKLEDGNRSLLLACNFDRLI